MLHDKMTQDNDRVIPRNTTELTELGKECPGHALNRYYFKGSGILRLRMHGLECHLKGLVSSLVFCE